MTDLVVGQETTHVQQVVISSLFGTTRNHGSVSSGENTGVFKTRRIDSQAGSSLGLSTQVK